MSCVLNILVPQVPTYEVLVDIVCVEPHQILEPLQPNFNFFEIIKLKNNTFTQQHLHNSDSEDDFLLPPTNEKLCFLYIQYPFLHFSGFGWINEILLILAPIPPTLLIE